MRRTLSYAAVLLTLTLTLAGPPPAAAVVIGCTELDLRNAITAINTGATTDTTITIPASCTNPITLTGVPDEEANVSGDFDLLASMTIEGAGELITILDGSLIDRVFDIAAATNVTIRRMTIRNGNANAGTAKIGGGIYVNGTLTLDTVAVSGSTANQGGGIFVDTSGAVTLSNSTISSNSATADGGGIFVNSGTFTATNSTISGNSAGTDGGGITGTTLSAGDINLTNVTIASNTAVTSGGGISNPTTNAVTIKNTIVASNTVGGLANCAGAAVNSTGNNLDSDGSCVDGTVPGDLSNITNPLLGPLANNGGPTSTHALLPGSPAIDAGDNSTCSPADQRGIPRADGDGNGTVICDIGAFEAFAFQGTFALSIDDASLRAGERLIVRGTFLNTGGPAQVDGYLGVIMTTAFSAGFGCAPNVVPIAFITSTGAVVRCATDSPTTFPAFAKNVTFPTIPSQITVQVLNAVIPGGIPPSTLTAFLAVTLVDAFVDGVVDFLFAATATFSIVP